MTRVTVTAPNSPLLCSASAQTACVKTNPEKKRNVMPKANPSRRKCCVKQSLSIKIDLICEAKPIHHDGKALRSKANLKIMRKGFAKQSQSGKIERLCGTKSMKNNGKASRSKANPTKRKGFAKQSQFIIVERLCAKQSKSIRMENLREAKPIQRS